MADTTVLKGWYLDNLPHFCIGCSGQMILSVLATGIWNHSWGMVSMATGYKLGRDHYRGCTYVLGIAPKTKGATYPQHIPSRMLYLPIIYWQILQRHNTMYGNSGTKWCTYTDSWCMHAWFSFPHLHKHHHVPITAQSRTVDMQLCCLSHKVEPNT